MEAPLALLTTSEMAAVLKRSPRTIAKMCRERRIAGAFLDQAGDWRITKTDFMRVIKFLRDRG